MKATKEQQSFLNEALEHQTRKLNLRVDAICTIRDCWVLLSRHLNDISDARPVGFGTARDWKLIDLDDCHIETVFRYIMQKHDKML